MATFRTNFDSVSNTISLKSLTTWFQEWLHRQQLQQQERKKHIKFQQKLDSSIFSAKTTEPLKAFKRKLRILFKETKQRQFSEQEVSAESEEIQAFQIVPELFSSTLIGDKATNSCVTQTTQKDCEKVLADSNMTIPENTFLDVRVEYPDIDVEIRAILTANAQNGITISEIKDEYRKQTGCKFPIYENITDFLLTIPHVTAECDENGTRIFNIKPTTKSKHLYDMVVNQKRPCDYNNNNYVLETARRCPQEPRAALQWRSNNYKRFYQGPTVPRIPTVPTVLKDINNKNNNSINLINSNSNNKNNNNLNGVLSVALEAVQQQQQQLKPHQQQHIENLCYRDNWNYLNTRFKMPNANEIYCDSRHQQQQQLQPQLQQHLLISQLQQQQQQLPQRNRCRFDSKQPPPSCSSPTNTRSSQTNDSLYSGISEYSAHILDFPLLGDDFFLYMARMELKCKFKKFEKVLQSGLCVSGQTILAAMRRLRQHGLSYGRTIIVNIGSVDIMHGRPLVQIEHDFRQLLNDIHLQNLVPILTTLAPLANYAHDMKMKSKLKRFNEFIKREGRYHKVIDIHGCLVNEGGTLLFDCYQSEARGVTGTSESHVFWNKIGRQRVLQMIEANLEY